jgi:aspartyl-tRNA(Asn)/glutamyl-tRNA(Gln) amidotransferase subunit A
MPEPHEMNAAELSRAFHDGDLSPVEVTQSLLARIEALDSEINAFCHLDPATSLAQAEESEKRWAEGDPKSPLDGVPVAIKDLLLTKGWPTLRGSRLVNPKNAWEEDAPSVARLREAGVVFIGKTTTPEYGWKGTTDSPLHGVTRNPWNAKKTPGGSSGGSAAALAARFCPLALGSDGGGSIRIPASFCGVFGLKPQFGRVPAYPVSGFGTVTHVGPMSRDVTGAAMLMNIITKPDARDWYSLPYEPTDYAADLEAPVRGKRIAFSPRLGYASKVDEDVETLVDAAVKRVERLGAHVELADPPGGDVFPIFRTLWWSAGAAIGGDLPDSVKALLDPGLRQVAEEGKEISAKEFHDAAQARAVYGSAMRTFMEKYDFIVTPALATTAFDTALAAPLAEDGKAWLSWSPFSFPFNLTQQPAASVPCGFTKTGMPVGLQIVGGWFADADVLNACAAYEAADPHYEATPPGF